jgi:hypothetical protein
MAKIGDENSYDGYDVIPKNTIVSRKSIGRYSQPLSPLTPEDELLYRECSKSLYVEYGFLKNSVISSYDSVVSGLDPKKSAGYPWNLVFHTKQEYWESEDSNYFVKYWDSLGTGDPIPVFCCVNVKEELRPISKVQTSSGRTIIAMDVNHLVASGIYCDSHNDIFIKNNLKCDSAVGLGFFYGGAQKLYDFMHPKDWPDVPYLLSADANKFDSRYHKLAFQLVYDFRYDCLVEKEFSDYVRLHNIKKQIYSSPLVDIDGKVYARETGNASGQGNTIVDNVEKNHIDVFFLWKVNVPKKYSDYVSFKKYTRLLMCGDDIFLSVHPAFQGVFNANSIEAASSRIGMDYTFEDKSFSTFDKLSFMGHRFIKKLVPGTDKLMWLPTIDCEKMLPQP